MSAVIPTQNTPFLLLPARLAAAAAPFASRCNGHLVRRVARLAILLPADAATLVLSGFVLRLARNAAWLPEAANRAVDQLLPYSGVGALELPMAVLLWLLLFDAYGTVHKGRSPVRRCAAAAAGVAFPSWHFIWNGPFLMALAGYAFVASTLALLLILENRVIEAFLRWVIPPRLRAVRVLLVAGRQDIRRARKHPAVSDEGRFEVRGVFHPDSLRDPGGLEQLCEAIKRSKAETLVLCCGALCDKAFTVVLDAATTTGCELVSLARSFGGAGSRPRMLWTKGGPLMVLASPTVRTMQLVAKRAVDVLGSALGLVLASPLLAVIALAIRLESAGPIIFGHRRVGVGGRPFRCLKFRTMRVDAEELLHRDPVLLAQYIGNNYKLPEGHDPRITRLGRLLRSSSLDELPQLWNVLRGDMSLVGPRPVVPDELEEYGERRPVLLSLKPGMAGAWAVNGRSRVGYPHRAKIELSYVCNWRFGLDLLILLRTLPAVLARRGAY
jgi:lipopolysaccharide/colanic/teichoic acid biosynthesis glycosyltransferase